jgi:hypothetical protein
MSDSESCYNFNFILILWRSTYNKHILGYCNDIVLLMEFMEVLSGHHEVAKQYLCFSRVGTLQTYY